MARTAVRLGVVCGAAGLLLTVAGVPAGAGASSQGSFRLLPAGATQTPQLSGKAHLVRTGSGRTILSVHVKGLAPGETYGVHLHNAPCSAASPGGGHYQNQVGGPAAPPNELWASDSGNPAAGLTANSAGNASGNGTATWRARPEAQAVVIHAGSHHGGTTSGGTKLACADLR